MSVREVRMFEATCDVCSKTERYEWDQLTRLPSGWVTITTYADRGPDDRTDEDVCPGCQAWENHKKARE